MAAIALFPLILPVPDLLKLLPIKQSSANKAILQLCKWIIFYLPEIDDGFVFAGTENDARFIFCLGTALNMISILYVESINDVSITINAKMHTASF